MMSQQSSTARPASLSVQKLESGIVTITFDRPDRLNAIDWQLYRSFEEALEDVARDSSVAAVIITGAGRAFCAGGDISLTGPREVVHERTRVVRWRVPAAA
jgi:enoyl-CoA hydratase/carnithine racemase